MPETGGGKDIRHWGRRAAVVARWCFGPAAVAFLILAGLSAREAVENVLQQAYWPAVAAAALLWCLLHLISPVFTWLVLGGFGSDIGYRQALAIHVNRLPARYLPGGIWHTVSRVADLHHQGVSRTHLSAMVVMENVLPVATALLLGGAFLLAAGQHWLLPLACIGLGLAALAACPLILRHRLLLGSQRAGASTYLRAMAVTTAFWLLAATAFACYWRAFPGAQSAPLPEVYGAYLLAWATGFVSIFAPQGLGVFESVAGVLLRGALPFGGAALLVAGFRAAILVADVTAYALFVLLRLTGLRSAGEPH